MSTGQRFWLIVFAAIVGGCGSIALGQLLWVQGNPGEAGMGRAFALFFWIAPAVAIGCALIVAYLTSDRPDR
jgi:hypothetical protein